jgi:Tfp pilus assembly PilM family ATPase
MARGSGLDLGRSAVRFATIDARKGDRSLQRYVVGDVEAGEAPAEAAAVVAGTAARKGGPVRVGLTGSDLMMRYLPVPPVEDWRLERLMEFEVRELEGRSGSTLATSYNLLPVPKDLDEDDTMLLALVREDLLDHDLEGLGGMPVQAFSPNAVALYNAYLALGDHEPSTTLIANLGAGTLDLALVRGTDLYFARSVTTPLEKRDETLATKLGTDPLRARGLIHKHLDLRAATGERLGTDAERVTRPLLPLYESLPTLLSGVVTLCKAQARLRELKLDRVLVTGGAAHTRGLDEFLGARLRVPVTVWNPAEMVDPSALSDDDADALQADGPACAVALGLALTAADSDLYALEILTAEAKRKKAFAERGVWNILAGCAAAAFLGLAFFLRGSLADAAESNATSQRRTLQAADKAHAEALGLLERVATQEALHAELVARFALNRSAFELLRMLETELPGPLWAESFAVRMEGGKDWGYEDRDVPVVHIEGRAEEDPRAASQMFGEFQARLESLVPRGPAGESGVKATATPRGRDLEWALRVVLVDLGTLADEETDS